MFRSAPTDRIYIFLLLFSFLLPSQLLAFQQDNEPIQIRLLRDISPRTIIVSTTGTANLYSGDPTNPIAQLGNRQKLTLTTSNNQVYLRSADGGIYARSLIIEQQAGEELTLEVAEARTAVSPRVYRGSFLIQVDPSTPSTLKIVNLVPLDDYVESVLASEFGFDELEAAKAMAISIRTLAYRTLQNQHGPDYAVPDNEMWQVYKGTNAITETVREAVASTAGEVLRFNGELIEAVYFASSGGHTANNEDVWDAAKIQPYLRGKDDPYDFNSPHHNWESTVSRDRLLRLLSDEFRFTANGIRILNRSRDGRVSTMAVTGENDRQEIMRSNDFRLMVNEWFGRETLKSTLFEVNVQPNMYIFSGKGFGHGVGLNQWGALQLSKKGNLYDEILAYYYNDVDIDRGGLVNRMLSATGDVIEGASDYFFDNEDSYSPNIDAYTVEDEYGAYEAQPASIQGDDPFTTVMGVDADEEEAEEEPARGRKRLFPLRKDPNRKPATRRPASKRIGW